MDVSKKNLTKRYRILFFLYLCVLCYFLFFAESLGRTVEREFRYNLEPFHEIKRYVVYADYFNWKHIGLNLIGNVVAFMPLGFFLPLVSRRKRTIVGTTLRCMMMSFLVEATQLITRLGSFDVDDIMLNTVGGLLGCVICYGYLSWYRKGKGNGSKTEKKNR